MFAIRASILSTAIYYRPKYMIDKMIVYPRYAKGGNKDVIKDLICVVLDDVGSSTYGFTLSETTKDSNSQGTLKVSKTRPRNAALILPYGNQHRYYAKTFSYPYNKSEKDCAFHFSSPDQSETLTRSAYSLLLYGHKDVSGTSCIRVDKCGDSLKL